jgi:isoquinoline 1-oxidoreductase
MTIYDERQMERDLELSSQAERVTFDFEIPPPTRRQFVQVLGAGLVIAVCGRALGQTEEDPSGRGARGGRGGGRGGGFGGAAPANLWARLHIGKDGIITVLCGKIECGQGARAEITQAIAEEMHADMSQVKALLGDTGLVPNDGPTVGSMTTPRTIPPLRQAAAAARELLVGLCAQKWGVPPTDVDVSKGSVTHATSGRRMTYGELSSDQDLEKLLAQSAVPRNVTVTAVKEWKVMDVPAGRPNARDIVTGQHVYPSDQVRPGMLYGKVLRAPSYGAKPTSIDTTDAKKMQYVAVIQDGDFVGVAAPTMLAAQKAIDAIALSSKWQSSPPPPKSSGDLPEFLASHARNIPANQFSSEIQGAAKTLKQSYFVPYVQHAPMEPRTALAEWADGKVTIWTASQNPFAVRQEVANTFRLSQEQVRVIINDFGGGFGGKHTGECAVEAARLAKSAGRPVLLRWTREEEFTWAYFRPAGVMQAQASLDDKGRITSWHFININSGPSAVQTPYNIARNFCQTVPSQPPLRHGSYRGLAATANAFARECFMDELAEAAGKDPLAFRLTHLEGGDERLRAVLDVAAKRFDWPTKSARTDGSVGVGLACATEKGSYTATCAEVSVDRENNVVKVLHVAHVFECGAIINPSGLLSQVQGAIIQGLGPILREEMVFEDGRMQNASFADYLVPRFADMPTLDIFLMDRPDVASAGAGETPLISVAPAVANAVSRVTGKRVRHLPITLSA